MSVLHVTAVVYLKGGVKNIFFLIFLWVWFREELAENYERAAAIAVFQGRIRRGIASLKDGAGVAQQQGDVTKGRYSTNLDHMTII